MTRGEIFATIGVISFLALGLALLWTDTCVESVVATLFISVAACVLYIIMCGIYGTV